MRTKQYKIDDTLRDCVLYCGGKGFKLYSPNGLNGILLVIGRKHYLIDNNQSSYKPCIDYINLPYNLNQKDAIVEQMNKVIEFYKTKG